MEFLMELVVELLLEGSFELSTNKKVPRMIRYPLIVLIVLLFSAVILLFFVLGILLLQQNVWVGIFLIAVGILLLISSISKFRKIYLEKGKE